MVFLSFGLIYDIYLPHYNLSLSKLEMNASHFLSDCDSVSNICFLSSTKYTGCTQCATPKLPKKVLHIRDIVAHWGHCPGKIEMKFLIKNRYFPKCCTKGTRGKTQITQKNVAHWGQCCTLGGCTLGATSVW
jgi:hypothetical protein